MTGVQTCALPICAAVPVVSASGKRVAEFPDGTQMYLMYKYIITTWGFLSSLIRKEFVFYVCLFRASMIDLYYRPPEFTEGK